MTKNTAPQTRRGHWPEPAERPSATPLTLRQTAPQDWQHDRPAFAGDPFMDWESEPEPPRDARWLKVPDQNH